MPSASAIGTELVTPGSLTVCVALLGAPAASLDQDNQLYGYNVAFATEIALRLNLQPLIQQQDFGALISMVQAHTCDISVSSQNITSDRTAQVNLIPYTQAKLGFPVVVAINNPDNIQTLADLCGRDVSAALGSTFVDEVNGTGDYTASGLNAACASAEAKPINLHTYPSEIDAVQALLDNSVAAYLGNSNFFRQYPDLIQASPATLPGTRQGIGVALDHPDLTAAVSAALSEMISDGTYLKILSQYVSAQSVDNFSIIETQ